MPILPPEGLTFWRADGYRVTGGAVETVPGANWKRVSPVAYYEAVGKARDMKGPHVNLLTLRAALKQGRDDLYEPLRKRFVSTFGLLGLFNETYLMVPVLPDGKLYIAPEAVVTPDGRLRSVDPLTEGLELVLDLLARQYPDRWRPEHADAVRHKVALPSEVGLISRSYAGPWKDMAYMPGSKMVPWTEAREPYAALFVLDPASSTRASVLSTREPLIGWETALLDFPTGPFDPGDRMLRRELNNRLAGASPYLLEVEKDLRRGWRCRSLMEAMALMLYLDLTGGSSIQECASHDCPNYFRRGSQENSIYCTRAHADRASSRKSRGKRA